VLFVVPTAARTLQPLALDALEKLVSVAAMLKFVASRVHHAFHVAAVDQQLSVMVALA